MSSQKADAAGHHKSPKKKGSWIMRKLSRRRPSEPEQSSGTNADNTAGAAASSAKPKKGSARGRHQEPVPPLPTNGNGGAVPSGRKTPTSAVISNLGSSTAADDLAGTLRLPSQNGTPAPRLAALPFMDSISSAEVVGSASNAVPPVAAVSPIPNAISSRFTTPTATAVSSRPATATSAAAQQQNGNATGTGGAQPSANKETDHGLASATGTVSDAPEQATTSGDTAEDGEPDSGVSTTGAASAIDLDGGAQGNSQNPTGEEASRALSNLSNELRPSHTWADQDDEYDDRSSRHPRDSTDVATMDTGKSRASTKPTTLMSVDAAAGPSMLAHIAQAPRREAGGGGTSAGGGASGGSASSPGIHFAGASTSSSNTGASSRGVTSGNSLSGQHAQQGTEGGSSTGHSGGGEDVSLSTSIGPGGGVSASSSSVPYVNVPGHSRPHPSNNPTPSGFPADNASMLTLASSNAAHSMTGGAASHRSGTTGFAGGAAPSLGGAKSIVGSLMGDRRNSSDTSASMKALPPLSRRGSESSTRTGADSLAPSSIAGSNYAAASGAISQPPSVVGIGVPSGPAAGPGAPSERISIQRTPSQRTVATQFSIPLSTHAAGGSESQPAGGLATSGSSSNVAATVPVSTNA